MSSETISLADILHIIKDRKEVWQTLYIYDRDQGDHSDRDRRFNRQINKLNRLNSNRDSYLTFDDICALYSYYSLFSLYSASSTYDNQKYQYRSCNQQSYNVKDQQYQFVSIFAFQLSAVRQPLRLISENTFDLRDQNLHSKTDFYRHFESYYICESTLAQNIKSVTDSYLQIFCYLVAIRNSYFYSSCRLFSQQEFFT